MAVNLRNVEEAKRSRKMSFSYLKDSLVRRSTRHSGPRSHMCCCENLDDVSSENEAVSLEAKNSEAHTNVLENCRCKGNARSDTHKTGVFKKLKERLQLKAGLVSRPMKCKSKQTAKILDSSAKTHPINMCDDITGEDFVQTSLCKTNLQPPVRFVRNLNIPRQCNALHTTVHRETPLPKSRDTTEEQLLLVNGVLSITDRVNCMSEDTKPCVAPRQLEKGGIQGSNNIAKSEVCYCGHIESDSCIEVSQTNSFCGDHSCDETLLLSNPTGGSLTCELFKLAKYGWYWGPITREEAEEKLIDLPDGAFLVRDSSADRYLLSVSFRSSGKTFHARIEYSHGLFSFYSFPGQEGFASIVDLINHSMTYSESAVFCYSRPRAPGYPSFPVRLAKPVSRFTQVRSLQYLCRFVIRQYVRVDNIQKLPLPSRLKGYIQEGHY
ncbi:hypothetical protein PR048_000971 [Dryococelus australis]|uniref:Suppressor of cytokine signaling 6 n=1 Tax=Dryococelus australis TaxID=614101 RepID=A0ABQ9IG24_9NEOP|nr:hypothetical protein PR048_000971 [Dryococelus australis]